MSFHSPNAQLNVSYGLPWIQCSTSSISRFNRSPLVPKIRRCNLYGENGICCIFAAPVSNLPENCFIHIPRDVGCAGGDMRHALTFCHTDELSWYNKGHVLAQDIARGLVFLHANRVVHSDLKSKNILLTEDYSKCNQLVQSILHCEVPSRARTQLHIWISNIGSESTTPACVGANICQNHLYHYLVVCYWIGGPGNFLVVSNIHSVIGMQTGTPEVPSHHRASTCPCHVMSFYTQSMSYYTHSVTTCTYLGLATERV